MKILITGSQGLIGQELLRKLAKKNIDFHEFDLSEGNDITNQSEIIEAGKACDIIVHLAAITDPEASPEHILRTNLIGTKNVLKSARINEVKKVIFMSSAAALGIFKEEEKPHYFPIDDQHPAIPNSPYSISKKLSEELCQDFTQTTGIPTICLRPPAVWNNEIIHQIINLRKNNSEFEWNPYWEYGAFIHVEDLVNLILKCINTDFQGHGTFLVSANDLSSSGKSSLSLTQKIHPDIPWEKNKKYEKSSFNSLINCSKAKKAFDWGPAFSWQEFMDKTHTT